MDSANNSRRRRGLGMVTANACTQCRKKRAKCDGQTPCSRCSSQKDIECVYEVPIRQSKEHIRSQIEELRAYQQQSGCVLGALISDDHSSQIVDWLRNGESLKNISDGLKKPLHAPKKDISTYPGLSDGQAIDAAMGPTSQFTNLRLEEAQGSISAVQHAKDQTPLSSLLGLNSMIDFMAGTNNDLIDWAPDTVTVLNTLSQYPALGHWHEQTTDHSTLDSTVLYARDQGQAAIFGHESGGDHSDQKSFGPLSWTNVTSDRQLVDYLIALYFCWEYPTFASLSKEHFLEAYKTGDHNYCTDLLVNAIQAVGCQFSAQAGARADPSRVNIISPLLYQIQQTVAFISLPPLKWQTPAYHSPSETAPFLRTRLPNSLSNPIRLS